MALLGLFSSIKQTVGNIILNNEVADLGTDANLSVKTLKTFTLPANTVSNNGDIIEIEVIFVVASPGASTILNVLLDGTTILSNSDNYDGKTIIYKIRINRTGSSAQSIFTTLHVSSIDAILSQITMTKDLTTDLDIIATGKNGTDSDANGVVCKQMIVRYFENI